MADAAGKAEVAFQIIMAFCADLGQNDPETFERVRELLSRSLQRQQQRGGHPADLAEVREALETFSRLRDDPMPTH